MIKRNKIFSNLSHLTLLRRRELGLRHDLGHEEEIAMKVYSNVDTYRLNEPLASATPRYGGIFNLEFSLDGHLLVAACEEKSFLIYDASNQHLIKNVKDIHSNCVNCVKFLDSHTFATCSDDSTVKLWDLRKVEKPMKTLHGHSNWVKNIEYVERDKLLVTSGFDGCVYAWDLKNPTENNLIYERVFVTEGLMRTRLTPDCSKLIICTTSGYIIIVHNLNLETLSGDMKNFRPNLYRLMQLSDQNFPAATIHNCLFSQTRKHNRIEFIDDFPNDAEVISSLQVHPMGWCALSRNVDSEETEEWTSVHDIQSRDPRDYADAYKVLPDVGATQTDSEEIEDSRTSDLWLALITLDQLRALRAQGHEHVYEYPNTTMINSGLLARGAYREHFQRYPEDKNRIVRNLPRLTHYIKEKSTGKGYIKESAFSNDGRIICTPYDRGVRLLGFNNRMQELCYCVPEAPKQLVTITELINYHPDVVVSCSFNPRHCQMVSGCLSGHIVWYRPIL